MEPAGILLLFTFPAGPLILGAVAWIVGRRSKSLSPAAVAYWPGVINASLYFALAFNSVYFIQEFFLAWPKSLLPGVEAVVYHNNHGWKGEHPDVLLYQGAGALAIIVLGAILGSAGWAFRNRLGRWHPLIWWTTSLALGLGLIQVAIAAMHPDNDVGQAFDFLKLSPGARLMLALAANAGCIGFGVYFTRPVLAMAPQGTLGSPGARVIYVLKFAILPLLLGTLIAWANRAPPIDHLTMPFFTGLFVLPWTLAAAALAPVPKPITDRLHRRVDWPLVAVSVVVLIFYRTVLANGMQV